MIRRRSAAVPSRKAGAALLVVMLVFVNSVACVDEKNNQTMAINATSSVDSILKNDTNQPYIQEITTTIAPILPIIVPTVPTTTNASDASTSRPKEAKSRALEFDPNDQGNNLSNKTMDLSNVSLDDDDENDETPMISAKILSVKPTLRVQNHTTTGQCEKGGLTYDNGEKLEVDCDLVCTCENGTMDCVDRCSGPYIRKGKKISDPFCREAPSDDQCCSVLQCTSDTEICHYQNKTYNRGDVIKEGCNEICSCEASGKLSCKPRCNPITKTSDKCLEIPDKNDPCCKTVICDVTLKDNKLTSAKYINATTIKLEFDSKLEPNQTLPLIDVSDDKNTWKTYTPLSGGYLSQLETTFKYAKIENTDDFVEIQGMADDLRKNESASDLQTKPQHCLYKGVEYRLGQEFNDACESFCVCREAGVKCLKMECPTYFGTDVLDPNCIEWETVPANFTPTPPVCCPERLHCKNNGSCEYEGGMYQNWQQVPTNVTGCEKRCYCEMGNVECQNICPPVTETPPSNLECPAHQAVLNHLPGDDCCMYWMCNEKENTSTQPPRVEEVEPGHSNKSNDVQLPFPFRPTKAPSKTSGPLLIYENVNHTLGNPKLQPDENHYLHNPHRDEPKHKKTVDTHTETTPRPVPSEPFENEADDAYLGPFNPTFKKPSKPPKSKPRPNFVTPSPQNHNNNNDNYIPEYNDHDDKHDQDDNQEQPLGIHIHGKGNPEELLHIINQHPELAEYPPGSVLEIHNVPPRPQQRPTQYNVNSPPNKNGPPGLPPGISLEQILQEIHKNGPNGLVPYPNNPSHPGQIYVQAPPHLQRPQTNGRPQQIIPGLQHPGMIPGNFPNVPGYQQPTSDITVNSVEAIDAHTVRLSFAVPPIIVGLHGRVEVRYTDTDDDNLNTWKLQVFATTNDLIGTQALEFDLVGLRADTDYRIKITITLRDLHNMPTSRIYKIRTLKEIPSSTMPAMIPIEPELVITEVNATWVSVAWRKFAENEMQYIDGVQLRFKEIDGKIYAATPLIHRAVTNYTLENLKPNTKYEIGIFFIPFAGQHTELHAEHMLHFTTANEIDTYGFNVTLEIALIKATNVEISWSGVPYPEDKYVNIYRAIYQSDSGKGDSSTFKVAKRDSPSKTSINDLKPGTRYRLWLEIYLTNGKIKTSNVQDFITKPRSAPNLGASSKQDKLSGNLPDEKSDYYGPLVIVAILAAIAILSTLVLLLILVRRHGQNKACITPPTRVSQSAYDNPTYKVEIQQETMDL
ncbi:putative epidermal cell surface receptor isoform X2 [Atheta coriaria]|uniref:putative epidermal cell surface receptor isoform X2 n=1 Tax=Dalotia coriaria TaxID=877792 RepID=UPI0031F441DA